MIAVGTRINDWTYLGEPSNGKKRYGRFKCECGAEKDVFISSVTTGASCSCGRCMYNKYNLSKRDYLTIYTARQRAIDRCYNPNNPSYLRYGPRGITVCEEWRVNPESFIKWAAENGWERGLSLDRIDNDKGYSPDNCRWATPKEQANNKSTNINLEHDGVTKTMQEWCEVFNVPHGLPHNRWQRGERDFNALFAKVDRRTGVMLYY